MSYCEIGMKDDPCEITTCGKAWLDQGNVVLLSFPLWPSVVGSWSWETVAQLLGEDYCTGTFGTPTVKVETRLSNQKFRFVLSLQFSLLLNPKRLCVTLEILRIERSLYCSLAIEHLRYTEETESSPSR